MTRLLSIEEDHSIRVKGVRMRPALVAIGLVAGLLVGLPGGWALRGTVSRWCSRCGQAIGQLCAHCLDELHPSRPTVVVVRQDRPSD
jgi:hypothetical protein